MKTISVQNFHGRHWRLVEWQHPSEGNSVDPQPHRSIEWCDHNHGKSASAENWHTDEAWLEEKRRPIPAMVIAWATELGAKVVTNVTINPSHRSGVSMHVTPDNARKQP